MKKRHFHADFIEKLGRTNDVAAAIGLPAPRISQMKTLGIPLKKYGPSMITLARSQGVEPTLKDLFDV